MSIGGVRSIPGGVGDAADDAAATAAAAPARPVGVPDWYPAGFDLEKAVAGARAILEAQGERPDSIGPGKADRIVFTDADHTLLKTTTPTLVKNKETGELLKHPETGRLVMLGRDYKKDLADLKARFPSIAWDKHETDFREFASIAEVLRTPEIGRTVGALRRSDKNPRSRDFIITARSDDTVATGLDDYLVKRGVDINGVFAVNAKGQAEKVGFADPAIRSAQRKALIMAAILKLYDPAGAAIRRVRFYEDSDENVVAAMQLLPKLFPKIKFEFVDVIHAGEHRYVHKLIARSKGGGGDGALFDGKGKKFPAEAIAAYKSDDVPAPPDPALDGVAKPGAGGGAAGGAAAARNRPREGRP